LTAGVACLGRSLTNTGCRRTMMVMINPMMSVSRFDGADREGRRGAGLWRILRSQALSRDLQDQEPGLIETRNRVRPSRNSPRWENSGVPFGKGTGRFSPASGSRSPRSPLAWSLGQRPRCLQQKAFACGWLRHHPARRANDQPMTLADRPNRAFGIGTSPAFRCRDPSDERSAPRRYGIERRRQNPPCQRDRR
jgi:hypothetical protein